MNTFDRILERGQVSSRSLARETGVSHSYITLIRRELRNVSPGIGVRLLEVMDLDPQTHNEIVAEWSRPARAEVKAWDMAIKEVSA